MPAKRAEVPAHGVAAVVAHEAPPSFLSDLAFLTELLSAARGASVGEARPMSASTNALGDSTSLAASSHHSTSSRAATRAGATSASSHESVEAAPPAASEEDIVWQLTSMLLRSREARTAQATTSPSSSSLGAAVHDAASPQAYWTDLKLQIHVDHLVEAVRYCARHDFSPLKSRHVLSWLLHYRSLVCSGVDGDCIVSPAPPTLALDTTTGTGSGTPSPRSPSAAATGSGSRKGPPTAQPAPNTTKTTARTASATTPKIGDETGEGTAVTPGVVDEAGSARPYLTVLAEELRRFALEEIESWWRWELVPREPKERDPALAAVVGPATGAKGTTSGAGGTGAGKKKMSERARLLLQQEEEEEERRLAAVAALPPQNIFLSEPEVEELVAFFAQKGWLPHTHLYQIFTRGERPLAPPGNASEVDVGPSFHVVVEQPMPGVLLTTATMSEVDGTTTAEGARHATFTGLPPVAPTSSATAATGQGKARTSSSAKKSESTGRSRDTSDVAEEEGPGLATEATLSPITALIARQESELADLERQHAQHCAHEAERARVAQLEQDMELHLEREGTSGAVRDVYQSLESQLTERELQILRRVEALEITLGMRPAPGDTEAHEADVPKPSSRSASLKKGGNRRKM